jgi:uncharacterized protein (TIGR03437 family)
MQGIVKAARWLILAAVTLLLFAPVNTSAQNVQTKDVMIQGQLTPGFDEGVNSSAGITNWVNPNPSDGSQKMTCPPNQDWCAMWLSYGPTLSGFPRPGIDMTSYSTLLVELRGDSMKTITIGVKDNTHADDGTETKVRVLLTTNWRTYAIPLSSFSPSAINRLYLVCEFVWDANSPWTAYVRTVRYTTAKAPVVTGLESAASYQNGLVAGGWTYIGGTDLSSSTRAWTNSDFQGTTLPVGLDGNSVQIGERSIPLDYISGTQINALPFGDVATGSTYLTVTSTVGTSLPFGVTVQSIFPGLFAIDPSNKYVAAVHLDGSLVGKAGLFGSSVPSTPAARGETIEIYGTGFGPTNPAAVQDQLIQTAFPLANASSWQARIGNVSAAIGFAGLTGSGLYQFNVTVPTNVSTGDQSLVISNGSASTQPGVLITVQ